MVRGILPDAGSLATGIPGLNSIQGCYAGRVSKSALLTWLLPLSFAAFLSSLSAGACLFPSGYDWRVRVISKLTSPHDNPGGYLLPSLGVMVAILLALPFAGYVAQRMHAVTPRVARSAGRAFTLGLVLMLIAMAVQLGQRVIDLRTVHTFLAHSSVALFVGGMLCCCLCALKDRLGFFGGRGLLPATLAFYWISLTVLPVACLAGLGTVMLLGHYAGQTWAEEFRQSFRQTIFWNLAFWEWTGIMLAFAFAAGSVWLLPVSSAERRPAGDRQSIARGARLKNASCPPMVDTVL
jgi:hypothetical protein